MDLQSQIVRKVKHLRKERGFSQPEMAELLHVDKSVYARLESGKTCSWVKHFEDLLNIFKITPQKFFEDIGSEAIINNNNGSLDSNNITVQNPHQKNREIYEKLIAAKDEQIALLKNLLETK